MSFKEIQIEFGLDSALLLLQIREISHRPVSMPSLVQEKETFLDATLKQFNLELSCRSLSCRDGSFPFSSLNSAKESWLGMTIKQQVCLLLTSVTKPPGGG